MLSDFSLLILIINTCIVQVMRTWEPVEVSSQLWICPCPNFWWWICSSQLWLWICPCQDLLWWLCSFQLWIWICPFQDFLWRICSSQLWIWPAHDGYALCLNLLWRTRSHGYNPSQLYGGFYKGLEFYFMGKDLIYILKTEPQVNVFISMSGSSSQTIAWSWDKRGSPKLIGGICTNLSESIFIKAVIQASWACHMHDRIENHIRATIMSSNRHCKWGLRLIIEFF